jgi:ionotropic glutamate receptor
MQTTVQSLEELARQSRINYSAVADSPYMEYFKNMAGAEEELYRKWKEITLNSSSDQSKYRVWDYPVREQYTHILKVIKQSGLVMSPEEGFKRVEAATKGEFAFIHDASEVRYQYYKNCNYLEVGEPFAEQPLVIN